MRGGMLRCMRRIATAFAVVVSGIVASPAAAGSMRGCGVIDGWRVAADAETTTCALARSATRSFLRRLGEGEGTPSRIVGRSQKTDRLYDFRLARTTSTSTTTSSLYRGRAGAAVLRVRISSRIY